MKVLLAEREMPNKALQPTDLPSLRYGKSAAEFGRWALEDDPEKQCLL